MSEIKMQSPWVSYVGKIREFFRRDPTIKVIWDEDTFILTMYVADAQKAVALQQILPEEKQFGNVKVILNIIPADSEEAIEYFKDHKYVGPEAFEIALEENPIYHFTKTFKKAFISNPVTYVVFAKEVLQWYNDDLGDLYGNANDLAENVAKDIFENTSGIFFCTDVE